MPATATAVDPRVETLKTLRSMDATLKAILLVLSEKRNDTPPGGEVASDSDLDGTYGNPIVKAKDPKDWTGEQIAGTGRRMSECPAEYLDLVASRLDHFAGKEPDAKKAGYNRLDARRARGWAARIRAGKVAAPAAVAQPAAGGDWESGFTEEDRSEGW